MMTASAVPATVRSSWLYVNWDSVGLTTNSPLMYPIFTAPTGP